MSFIPKQERRTDKAHKGPVHFPRVRFIHTIQCQQNLVYLRKRHLPEVVAAAAAVVVAAAAVAVAAVAAAAFALDEA